MNPGCPLSRCAAIIRAMTGSFSTTAPGWREEGQRSLPSLQTPQSRAGPILLVLVGMATLVGLMAGLLFWLRPTPGVQLVPLWVAHYNNSAFPDLPGASAERAALQNLFPTSRPAPHLLQEQHVLLRDLAALQPVETPVVVYLRGYAQVTGKNEVQILPSDASPNDPSTRLPLARVLELLRLCPARNRLLILDLAQPLVDPSLGILTPDVAGAIPSLIEAAGDPGLLVLCSCSPGQTSHYSEVLGRSVFNWYLEQGLRGHADGYSLAGQRDGRITVRELAAFLRARVDRWVVQNHDSRQTPTLLGAAPDFPLRVFEHHELTQEQPLPAPGDYPPTLLQAFKQRQALFNDTTYWLAPFQYQQAGMMLVRAEEEWRGFNAQERRDNRLLQPARQILDRLAGWRHHWRVVPQSLAQAHALGEKGDETVVAELDDLLVRLEDVRQSLKPDEAAKAQAKIVADFQAKLKNKSPLALRFAVFQKALSLGEPSPADLLQLDRLLRPLQFEGQPEYVETLILRQLAQLGEKIEPGRWPAALAGLMLEVTDRGEKAASQFRAFPWVAQPLQLAANLHHQGALLFWADGYAASEEARLALTSAKQRYEAILGTARVVNQAQALLDEALTVLPFYPPLLALYPDQQRRWREAVQVGTTMYQILTQPPPGSETLGSTVKDLEQATVRLEELLRQLRQPWSKDNIERLTVLSRDPRTGPGALREIRALQALPTLQPDDRVTLWQANRTLALRLHQATAARDAEDNSGDQLTADQPEFEFSKAEAWQRSEGLRQAEAALALLQLGGLSAERLAELKTLLNQAEKAGAAAEELHALAEELRLAWRKWLPDQLVNEPTAAQQDRLSRIFSPWPGLPPELERETPLALQRLRASAFELAAWLVDWHRYQARDYQSCGLEPRLVQPLARFHGRAANNFALVSRARRERYIEISAGLDLPRLTPNAPAGNATFQFRLVGADVDPGPVELRALLPDLSWLRITPAQVPSLPLTGDRDDKTIKLGRAVFKVDLVPNRTLPATSRPRGVLLRAQAWGRSFHRILDVPLISAVDQPQLLLNADPQSADAPLSMIRIRPGKIQTSFYLHVRNPGEKPRKVIVQLQAGEGKSSEATLTINAGEAQRVRLSDSGAASSVPAKPGEPGPPLKADLPPLEGPLRLTLLDGENRAVLETRTVPVEIASPREYVAVTDIKFEPAAPHNKNKNLLSATLQPLSTVKGADIPCELVLPEERIPGLLAVKGGTFRGKLALSGKTPQPLTLFAQELLLAPAADEEGVVYIHCDGYDRCFIYRTTFARQGDVLTPRGDGQPAIRIRGESFVVNRADLGVVVEVDNAPGGASVQVSLGRATVEGFQADSTWVYSTPREQQVGFRIDGTTGALLFAGSIRDWRVPLDTSKIVGSRQVRARLLDEHGGILSEALHTLVIDDTAPTDVRLLPLPAKAKKGSTITVRAIGRDPESGITHVHFFVGRLQPDGKPPTGVTLVRGAAADKARTLWTAQVPLPEDRKGPTPITVQMSNRAGVTTSAVAELELTDEDPALTAPGTITGKVVLGSRGQPNLEVILKDAKGTEKARVKTRQDGSFVFEAVPPGQYTVHATKREVQRRGQAKAAVEPGKTVTVTVELTL